MAKDEKVSAEAVVRDIRSLGGRFHAAGLGIQATSDSGDYAAMWQLFVRAILGVRS